MTEKKRMFIAVNFPENLQETVEGFALNLQRKLDPDARSFKWVEPRNIHLTLQFLGDVDMGLLPKLAGGLPGAFSDIPSFHVQVAGCGAFPSLLRPRIIWAGMRHGADGFRALHSATLRVTEDFGFVPETRPFKAHMTLARLRRSKQTPDIREEIENTSHEVVGECQIERVVLMASELKPNGPIYSILDSFDLGN